MTDPLPDHKAGGEEASEDVDPTLLMYKTPYIYAFPISLAVIKKSIGLFNYDCTSWLREPLRDLQLLWRIVDFAEPFMRKGDSATPTLHLGARSDIHVYAVFPHLKAIGETAKCPVFKEWHDEIM